MGRDSDFARTNTMGILSVRILQESLEGRGQAATSVCGLGVEKGKTDQWLGFRIYRYFSVEKERGFPVEKNSDESITFFEGCSSCEHRNRS